MPIAFGSVSELARAFGRIPAEVAVELRPAVLRGAELIQKKAQGTASWSTRIPGAISARAALSQSGGAVVTVDSVAAPHARPYEGITGNSFFRHPVFGNRENWVSENTRPFLKPARDSEGPEVVALIETAINATTQRLLP